MAYTLVFLTSTIDPIVKKVCGFRWIKVSLPLPRGPGLKPGLLKTGIRNSISSLEADSN
jgi:hypothetical protein